jgi:two-component system cell cycle sensor histidine kinase/response regulator CckA
VAEGSSRTGVARRGPGLVFTPVRGTRARLTPVLRAGLLAVMAAGLALVAGGVALGGNAPLAVALGGSLAAGALWAALRWTGPRPGLDGRLRQAFDADDMGLALLGADGRFSYANGAFTHMLGHDPARPLSLETVRGLLAPGERADASAHAFERLVRAAVAGAAAREDIALARPGAQGRAQLSVTVRPFGGAGETLWRMTDRTAQNEIETVLRLEHTLTADFLDAMPVGFVSVDAGGRILYANQALADWLGLGLADNRGRGRPFAEFVIDSGRRETIAEFDGAGDHGRVTLRGADESFEAYLIQSEVKDGEGTFVRSRSVVLRDVAPVSASAADEIRSRRRLHWLFDRAPVGIALVDLSGIVVDCNRALLKLVGSHRDAVVGRPLAERIRPEDRDGVAGQLSKVVMGTMPAAHLEVRLQAAVERAASLYASRMEDRADGEVSGLILHFIDTTRHKSLETQFAQSQKMQAVGQLAGGVAHDFNNLLTAMIGFSDLLLERHGPDDPSFADIMHIKQNANRATNLVRQLLAFSRKQTLQPRRIDVAEELRDLSHLLRRLIGETIELVIEHHGQAGEPKGVIRTDPGQFDQVIINLAVNARDAMPRGGTLAIRTSRVHLNEPMERSGELMPAGEYVAIEVADTGGGIPKENLARIFEPFFSTKRVGEGTGLGLSTVYGIVRQSDGFIFVDSALGEGATFSIYLPDYTESQPGAEGDVQAAAAAGSASETDADLTGAGTVLLVEDEDAVRMFGARALRNKGYTVLEADSGEAALDVINNGNAKIDLLISDVVMPGMDGHTLAHLVRHEHPHVKIILMSGYAEDVNPDEIGRDPTMRFLPKPFTLKKLAGMVKDVLTERPA